MYWLVAGAGMVSIFALCGAVFLTPAHPHVEPTIVQADNTGIDAKPVQRSSTPPDRPATSDTKPDQPQIVTATQQAEASDGGESPPALPRISAPNQRVEQPRQLAAEQVAVPMTTQAAVVNDATLVSIKPTKPRVMSATPNPPSPVTPSTAPILTAAKPSDRQVDTVVVTAAPYQQMALNIDSVGRGNTLVIQLPRTKRN